MADQWYALEEKTRFISLLPVLVASHRLEQINHIFRFFLSPIVRQCFVLNYLGRMQSSPSALIEERARDETT
jgi:hypothetical protein